jgi:hypothetical protein
MVLIMPENLRQLVQWRTPMLGLDLPIDLSSSRAMHIRQLEWLSHD